MSFFKREQEPTQAELNINLRDNAIEYIKSLDKAEKDKFFDSMELIWQGYDKLFRVKTKDQKETEKDLKEWSENEVTKNFLES